VKLSAYLFVAAGALMIPGQAWSHFSLLEPAASLGQDDRGDPQKKWPCGGTTQDAGTPTAAVTAVRGGQMLHIKVAETVYHPGHYRIALARTPEELPVDPETVTRETERGLTAVSAKIDPSPKAPVLADGLFVHTERVPSGTIWETDVRVPNIDCENCTLQVIQWMAGSRFREDGAFSYHHCAALKITADPALPVDAQWLAD
jgi:hypothetical protein